MQDMLIRRWYHFISWLLKNITYSHFNIIRTRVSQIVRRVTVLTPENNSKTKIWKIIKVIVSAVHSVNSWIEFH